MLKKQEKRYQRHKRVRAKISGTSKVPRLCVFKSGKYIYAQLIDDEKGHTLIEASDLKIKPKTKKRPSEGPKGKLGRVVGGLESVKTSEGKEEKKVLSGKKALAYEVGKSIAEKAIKKKIKKIVFDRGGYKYHGRVKALAEGAREGGLQF